MMFPFPVELSLIEREVTENSYYSTVKPVRGSTHRLSKPFSLVSNSSLLKTITYYNTFGRGILLIFSSPQYIFTILPGIEVSRDFMETLFNVVFKIKKEEFVIKDF